MSYQTKIRPNRLLTGGALVLAIASAVYAQDKPFSLPGTALPVPPPPPPKAADAATAPKTLPPVAEQNAVDKFFTTKIPEVIAKGKFSLNARLRYEWVDQSTFGEEANAPTVRTRFGYTTAPLYGFQGMLEGENITVIGSEKNFNAAGSNKVTDRPVVADPPTTEMNQAWLSYTYTNCFTGTLKGGRQRIALDNHRFIGDVGWRQNMQTYDAMTAEIKPIADLSLYYGYLWEVNRVFGDVEGLSRTSPNHDFDSDSHIVNISYSGWEYARFVGYSYLLDLQNRASANNSCATYGGYVAGSAPVHEKVSIGYRGEFAYQTDYAESMLDYAAEYYNVELNATIKPVAFGAGYEVLGTDSNRDGAGSVGFKTPLATLHAFNGWADVFLTTPAKGLRDVYGFAQVTVPGDVPIRAVYHKYDADSGEGDFGWEFDLMASKKFGKYWTVMAKYAYYDGKDGAAGVAASPYDVHKFWAQVEFNF
jgi:hypothetical protein